ncbi:MAG: nuclear transport factor 2 family protein [Mycobacteriales bacterium]
MDGERNKETVRAFYAALVDKDFERASRCLGPRYVQHNPLVGDGIEGFEAFLGYLRREFPGLRAEIKQLFADGDYVIGHVHGIRVPGQRGSAIVDIFRLEDGRIVEHWDVQQPIPAEAANPNGMF